MDSKPGIEMEKFFRTELTYCLQRRSVLEERKSGKTNLIFRARKLGKDTEELLFYFDFTFEFPFTIGSDCLQSFVSYEE